MIGTMFAHLMVTSCLFAVPGALEDPVVATLVVPDFAAAKAKLDKVRLTALANLVFPGTGRMNVEGASDQTVLWQLVWDKTRDQPKPVRAVGHGEACGESPPDSLGYACVDVRALFNAIGQGEHALHTSALFERFGFDALQKAVGRFSLEDDGSLASQIALTFATQPRGLLAALTPAALPDFFGLKTPADVEAMIAAGVRPEALYYALAKLISYEAPLEYGLWKLQIEGLQKQLGYELVRDALGDGPQPLRAVIWSSGERAAVLEVRDGELLKQFVVAYLDLLRQARPHEQIIIEKTGATTRVMVQSLSGRTPTRLFLAFDKHRLALGTARAAPDGAFVPTSEERAEFARSSVLATGFIDHGRDLPELKGLRSVFEVQGAPTQISVRVHTRATR
jgi:hypothetical protein